MREKKACCAHLCAVLMNKPEAKFRDFVEPWMTLAGHCKQLKLDWDDASLDGSQFPVPFLPDVEAMMGSDSLDRNVALAGKELKAVFGRVVGTAEEALKKRKRLADEVANGAKTGITTTESKDAAAGGVKRPRKCGPCTTRLGTPVLLIDCGGDRNGHGGSSARSVLLRAKAEEPALQLPVQEMPQVLKVPAGERPLSEPAGKMPMAVPVGQMSIQGRPQVLAVPVGEMPMAVPAGQMPIEGWPQVLAAPVKWWPL
jgi:hypothetical protein